MGCKNLPNNLLLYSYMPNLAPFSNSGHRCYVQVLVKTAVFWWTFTSHHSHSSSSPSSPFILSLSFPISLPIFIAQCYATVVYDMARVYLSIRMSVTSRCSTEMAECRIMLAVPHNSIRTLIPIPENCASFIPGNSGMENAQDSRAPVRGAREWTS